MQKTNMWLKIEFRGQSFCQRQSFASIKDQKENFEPTQKSKIYNPNEK